MEDKTKNNGKGTQNGNINLSVYSAERIADMLDVKVSFVNREIREGHLKGFKVGKSWRVTHEALEEYFENRTQNGNGKRAVNELTKDKIRFHANVRRLDEIPTAVQEMGERITRIKGELPEKESYGKLAAIIKMKKLVEAKTEKEEKLATKEEHLNKLVDRAYPGMRDLLHMTPDELEEYFQAPENANNEPQAQYAHQG